MRSKRPILAAVPIVAALMLASCAPESKTAPVPVESAQTQDTGSVIATGLETPWSIAFHGDTALISERDSARILEFDAQGQTREVAIIDGVRPRGEGGLLGIAVQDDYLYAYFTATDNNRIERYPLGGESGNLSLGDPEVVLDGIPAASHHNGGRIAFGPDGMLYATTGDAGNAMLAQELDSLAGKILRMTPEGAVPGDNPFDGSYVYSYGHRNPQGIAWDDQGTMYSSEFGQNTWDELNVIEAGGNYGWPVVEGIAEEDGYIDPVQQWEPAVASPSGMTIAGGSIWIANLRGERLRQIPLEDLTDATDHWTGEQGRLRDAVVTPDGAIWVLTNNTDGRGDPGPKDDRILQFSPAS